MRSIHFAVIVLAALPLLAADVSFGQSRGGRRERFNRGDRDAPSRPSQTQAAVPSTGPTASAGHPGAMQDQFKVLLERSIFAKSGVAAPSGRTSTSTSGPTAPPMSPEQAVVFIGVMVMDGEYVAYVENQQTHLVTGLRAGDDVARGKVEGITLDTLGYGAGGAIKLVSLGHNLAGELSSTSFASGSTSTTGPSSGSSTAGMPADQAAVVERLRARARTQRGE